MYYNAAITPWLNMALDLQVVDSGYNKALSSSGRLVNTSMSIAKRWHRGSWGDQRVAPYVTTDGDQGRTGPPPAERVRG